LQPDSIIFGLQLDVAKNHAIAAKAAGKAEIFFHNAVYFAIACLSPVLQGLVGLSLL